MPLTDHLGLTSPQERKRARKARFIIRWILLLAIFGLLLLFSIYISHCLKPKEVDKTVNAPAIPQLLQLTYKISDFFVSYWYIFLGLLIALGVVLELVAEAKWKLTLVYIIILVVLGVACIYAYKTADNFLKTLTG
jgi:hypothetical protein